MATTASGSKQVADDRRLEMVERIFKHFDADGDGGLDRREMAALVVALNPRIKFTEEQTDGVVEQVFQFYSKAARVTLGALLCIYDDIAGDVHLDFDALFLGHLSRHNAPSSPENGHHRETTSHDDDGEEEEEGDIAYLSSPPFEMVPSIGWLLSRSLAPQSGAGYAHEVVEAHLSFPTVDRLPSTDSSLASSVLPSEVASSEFDYGGRAPPFGSEELPSLRWLLSPAVAPPRGPSTDSSLASSVLPSEGASSESDYGGRAPPFGSEEVPSLRWMLSPAVAPPRGTGGACSLASSSLSSEAEFSDVDRGGYAPQSEWEEIPSFRWLESPPLGPQARDGYAPEEKRSPKRGRGASSWAGLIYRLRNLRRKK